MMLFLWKEGSRGMSLSGVMSFKSLLCGNVAARLREYGRALSN